MIFLYIDPKKSRLFEVKVPVAGKTYLGFLIKVSIYTSLKR